MEQDKTNTVLAGIDVGKARLDAAIHGRTDSIAVSNDAEGIGRLSAWPLERGVTRAGLEATGGLERQLRLALEACNIEVVVHQPAEVKLFGRISRQRAKTDAADARLIAAATAAIQRPARRADPVLLELGERLTAYEQVADMLMSLRTFCQSLTLSELDQMLKEQIAQLLHLKAALARQLVEAIKANAELRSRYLLLTSLPGIGPIVAASLAIRMPELGSMQRGQPASLVGVAPHARRVRTVEGQALHQRRARPTPPDALPGRPRGPPSRQHPARLRRPPQRRRQTAKARHRRYHAQAHRSRKPRHQTSRTVEPINTMNMVAPPQGGR